MRLRSVADWRGPWRPMMSVAVTPSAFGAMSYAWCRVHQPRAKLPSPAQRESLQVEAFAGANRPWKKAGGAAVARAAAVC